jgi:PIN domain nuclease of toxin-antitoxin system
MRVLLDTHVLLWAVDQPSKFDEATLQLLVNGDNEIFFSAASIWEIAIKSASVKHGFDYMPQEVLRVALETGFSELSVTADDALRVHALPQFPDHRDPFDRLLIAQAQGGPYQFLTVDTVLPRYSPLVSLLPLRQAPVLPDR